MWGEAVSDRDGNRRGRTGPLLGGHGGTNGNERMVMATAQMKMPDEFLNRLTKLGERTDDVIRGALKAAGDIAADEVRANLKAVVGKGCGGYFVRRRRRSGGDQGVQGRYAHARH